MKNLLIEQLQNVMSQGMHIPKEIQLLYECIMKVQRTNFSTRCKNSYKLHKHV